MRRFQRIRSYYNRMTSVFKDYNEWHLEDKRYTANLVICILAALFLITYYFLARPIIQIGSWKIYQSDVEKRDLITKSFFPKVKESTGLGQLKESAVYLKILQNNGVTLNREEILAEANRIDQKTLAPEHLLQIKNIFEGNFDAYLRNYVLPNLVNRIITYEFFPNSPDIHKKSLSIASELIEKAKKSPQSFQQIADTLGVSIVRVTVSPNNGLIWHENEDLKESYPSHLNSKVIDKSKIRNEEIYNKVQNQIADNSTSEAQKWWRTFAQKLLEGEVLEKPINSHQSWLVIRGLKHSNNNERDVLVAIIPKIDFETWLEQEKRNVEN